MPDDFAEEELGGAIWERVGVVFDVRGIYGVDALWGWQGAWIWCGGGVDWDGGRFG